MSTSIDRIFLSLGSNLGDRRHNLEEALHLLQDCDVQISGRSSLYETAPQDFEHQPWFLNLVVSCNATYSPPQLLSILLDIERQCGRVRSDIPKGPRLIDLDILLFGDRVIDTPELQVPHPRMLARRFVLEPLLELAPDLHHPVTNQPLRSYLKSVADQKLTKLNA